MWNEVDYDAVTGQSLDPKLVKRGKEEEMRRFEEMKVYEYVIQNQALEDPESVIIDVRWDVVNKGTLEEPNVRCRLVGREFADKGNRDDLFAGTPPLVTIRILLSILSKRAFSEEDMGAMNLDVKGAFLYGKTKRNVYIWLPPEDPRRQEGLMGKLNKAMYGTRDAPQVWQEEVRTTMTDMKFKECVTQPGIYFHEDRHLQVVSHVGDFLCVGSKQSLRWSRRRWRGSMGLKRVC